MAMGAVLATALGADMAKVRDIGGDTAAGFAQSTVAKDCHRSVNAT